VVFLSIVRNAMNLQGVEPLLQGVVTGALVIVAVALFTRRET
jgi:ribose/xylose/arabinose/galactoside ABC-type transport system permease subunit